MRTAVQQLLDYERPGVTQVPEDHWGSFPNQDVKKLKEYREKVRLEREQEDNERRERNKKRESESAMPVTFTEYIPSMPIVPVDNTHRPKIPEFYPPYNVVSQGPSIRQKSLNPLPRKQHWMQSGTNLSKREFGTKL